MSAAPRMRAVVLAAAVLASGAIGCGDDRPSFPDAGAVTPNAPFPPTLALGSAGCGVARSESFTVQNTGNGNLSYAITSSNAALTVTPSSGTIIAGTSTTFMASFTVPSTTVAGTEVKATLTVATNATARSATVEVTAVASGAQIVVDGSAAFGEIVRGGTDGSQAVTFRNTGNAPATVMLSKAPIAPFALTWPGAPGPTQIAGGGRLDATATFHPAALGSASGTAALTVTGVQCGTPASGELAFAGTGVRSGQVRVVGGADFGEVACGADPDSRVLTVINDGAVPATWSASFLDVESDAERYDVTTAGADSLAPDAMATITIKRQTLGTAEVPFVPRDVTATLRVRTTAQGAAAVNHDVDVRQLLRGAYLDEPGERPPLDFGFRPPGSTTLLGVTVVNRGNVAGVPQVSGLEEPLGSTVPAEIKEHGSGEVSLSYGAGGEQSHSDQTAEIGAANDCRGPLSVRVSAGSGPLASFSDVDLEGNCRNSELDSRTFIQNAGNQALQIFSCEVIDDPDNSIQPQLPDELPGPIPPAGRAEIGIGFKRSALDRIATIRCQVNEPAQPTRIFKVRRRLTGADIEISTAGSLKFTCEQAASEVAIRIHNAGNIALTLQPRLDPSNSYPVQVRGEPRQVEPGQDLPDVAVTHAGDGGGSGGPCSGSGGGSGGGDEIVFDGSVSIEQVIDDASLNICSISPADGLPVTMTRRRATELRR